MLPTLGITGHPQQFSGIFDGTMHCIAWEKDPTPPHPQFRIEFMLCTINRFAGCFEPEVQTGPKNVAVSDWQSQLFAFAVTAAGQKYERQHIVW